MYGGIWGIFGDIYVRHRDMCGMLCVCAAGICGEIQGYEGNIRGYAIPTRIYGGKMGIYGKSQFVSSFCCSVQQKDDTNYDA